MSEQVVPRALKTLYGRLKGELLWIEAPPKTMGRKWRGGSTFEAGASERAARAEEIRTLLNHLAHVIWFYESDWDPGAAKVVRPTRERAKAPSNGWGRAGLQVLRGEAKPMTIAELVAFIAADHGIDVSTVAERQRCHTALNNAFSRDFTHVVRKDNSAPARWSLIGS